LPPHTGSGFRSFVRLRLVALTRYAVVLLPYPDAFTVLRGYLGYTAHVGLHGLRRLIRVYVTHTVLCTFPPAVSRTFAGFVARVFAHLAVRSRFRLVFAFTGFTRLR